MKTSEKVSDEPEQNDCICDENDQLTNKFAYKKSSQLINKTAENENCYSGGKHRKKIISSRCRDNEQVKVYEKTITSTPDKENYPDSKKLTNQTSVTFNSHFPLEEKRSHQSTSRPFEQSETVPNNVCQHKQSSDTKCGENYEEYTSRKRKQSESLRRFRTDNRRMTGNVNIYICSEATGKVKPQSHNDQKISLHDDEAPSETKSCASSSSLSTEKLMNALKNKQKNKLNKSQLENIIEKHENFEKDQENNLSCTKKIDKTIDVPPDSFDQKRKSFCNLSKKSQNFEEFSNISTADLERIPTCSVQRIGHCEDKYSSDFHFNNSSKEYFQQSCSPGGYPLFPETCGNLEKLDKKKKVVNFDSFHKLEKVSENTKTSDVKRTEWKGDYFCACSKKLSEENPADENFSDCKNNGKEKNSECPPSKLFPQISSVEKTNNISSLDGKREPAKWHICNKGKKVIVDKQKKKYYNKKEKHINDSKENRGANVKKRIVKSIQTVPIELIENRERESLLVRGWRKALSIIRRSAGGADNFQKDQKMKNYAEKRKKQSGNIKPITENKCHSEEKKKIRFRGTLSHSRRSKTKIGSVIAKRRLASREVLLKNQTHKVAKFAKESKNNRKFSNFEPEDCKCQRCKDAESCNRSSKSKAEKEPYNCSSCNKLEFEGRFINTVGVDNCENRKGIEACYMGNEKLSKMICVRCDESCNQCSCKASIRKYSPDHCCDCRSSSLRSECREIILPDRENNQTDSINAWELQRETKQFSSKDSRNFGDDCCFYEKTKPYGSDKLAYQKTDIFSDVMTELQRKISDSNCCNRCSKITSCCPEFSAGFTPGGLGIIPENLNSPSRDQSLSNCKCLKTNVKISPSEICDICELTLRRCKVGKRPQAKCFYCKEMPCSCGSQNEEMKLYAKGADEESRSRGKGRKCLCSSLKKLSCGRENSQLIEGN